MTSATVELYETTIGAVTWDPERELGIFEYAPEFLCSGIEISPVMLPLGAGRFPFPNLPRETFRGLPGLLADSLPDKFGNLLGDQWLARQGRLPESFDPVGTALLSGHPGDGSLGIPPHAPARHPAGNLAPGSTGPARQ